MTEKNLLKKITQPNLAEPDQRLYNFLSEKQKNETISDTGLRKLENFVRLSEKNGETRQQSLVALSQMRGISVAELAEQLGV